MFHKLVKREAKQLLVLQFFATLLSLVLGCCVLIYLERTNLFPAAAAGAVFSLLLQSASYVHFFKKSGAIQAKSVVLSLFFSESYKFIFVITALYIAITKFGIDYAISGFLVVLVAQIIHVILVGIFHKKIYGRL